MDVNKKWKGEKKKQRLVAQCDTVRAKIVLGDPGKMGSLKHSKDI